MSENRKNLSKKYSNICQLNKKIDLTGYFKGIQNIENEEHKISGLFLIISLVLFSTSISMPKEFFLDLIVALVFLILSIISFFKVLQGDKKYIEDTLTKRVNEEDTEKLILLKNNGEKTKSVVDKVLSEHEDGLLTYEAIAKHLEELVVVYNVERSQLLNKIFEENGGENGS